MNAALLAVIVLAFFALGYHFYSRFLARVLFQLSADEPVPKPAPSASSTTSTIDPKRAVERL